MSEAKPQPYPPSFGQRRLWFLDQLDPGTAVYNVPSGVRITGPLRVDVLRRCLDTVVRRHAALRTTFPQDESGQPVQLVSPPSGAALTVVDVGDRARGDPFASAQRLALREARTPFDLQHGPLFRALLIRVATDDHVLVLNVHHIVSDGWSLTSLLDELGTCYDAYLARANPALPELPVQYADFAAWQRERMGEAAAQERVDYWVRQLAGAPGVLALPTDRPRPTVQSYRGVRQRIDLPRTLAVGLRGLSRSLNSTLFMTLLAAFQTLLSRYSGQKDIVVGSPIDLRTRAEFHHVIGFFVNTVALRTSLDDDPTFQQLVHRVRETTLDALSNADVPFESLVEVLQPERTLAHAPIFQAHLIVQGNWRPWHLGDLSLSPLWLDTGTAKFDLTLLADERGEDITMTVEYATDLFEAGTITRLGKHLTTLLAAVVADPRIRVSQIPLLAEAERRQVLVDWNRTTRPVPAVRNMPELLAPRFAQDPAGLAVVADDGSLSYGQVGAQANRLANLLRSVGVGPDVAVGLCVDRTTAMLSSLLGVWQAGGGYLPMDAGWPADRLRGMLDDARVPVIVTDRAARKRLGAGLAATARIICLDDDAAELAAQPATAPECPATPDNLAYLIYTSGSTGRPKGVAVTHRSVVNLMAAFAETTRLTPADRWAAVTTLSFDISVVEMALPVLCGAPVIIVNADEAGDGAALQRRLAHDAITVLQATPATWRMLWDAGGVPAGVRLRLCGGEALSRELAGALAPDGVTLWNVYGPTETTVYSSGGVVSRSGVTKTQGTGGTRS